MSSQAARTAFRNALAAGFPTLAIYETLAIRVDNTSLPDIWATTDFIPISDTPISLGQPSCCREVGTFRTYVVARAGAGEAAAIAQADAIVDYFRRWRDVAAQIRVTQATPPSPSDMSDGRWLVVACDFVFNHDHVS